MDNVSATIRPAANLAVQLAPIASHARLAESCRGIAFVLVVSAMFACGTQLCAGPDLLLHTASDDVAPATPRALAASDRAILENHHAGDAKALRARPDRQRERLWVLTLDEVYVYDTRKRERIRRIRLPEWFVADFMCAPDMVLDKSGTAFVSNNVQPRVVEIAGDDFEVKEYQLRLISAKQWDIGFGALAFAPDGTLFALSALAGSLFRIDLSRGTATEVERSQMDAAAAATAVNLRAGCSPL